MPAVGKMRAAKNSRVIYTAVTLRRASWKATAKADDLDTTNFESGGHEQGTIGVDSIEWSLGGDWDASINEFDDAPGLYPRDDGGSLKLFTNVSDNVFWLIAATRVLSSENGADIKGKVTFAASGKSQGVALHGTSLPTGSV